MISGMPEQSPSARPRARHELPTSPHSWVVSALLGVSWLAAVIAAFAIGYGVTGESGTSRPGMPSWQEPGLGAALVGASAALMAFLAGAQISLLRDRRLHPYRRYRTSHGRESYTISQSLRRNPRVLLLLVPMALLGLWLRHRYG